MDHFIETWLHVSPDGGSGALEAMYLASGLAIVVAVVFRRRLFAVIASWASLRTFPARLKRSKR